LVSALVNRFTPRENLAINWGVGALATPKFLKQFVELRYSGLNVRNFLEEGLVEKGTKLMLVEKSANSLTVRECFSLFLQKKDL